MKTKYKDGRRWAIPLSFVHNSHHKITKEDVNRYHDRFMDFHEEIANELSIAPNLLVISMVNGDNPSKAYVDLLAHTYTGPSDTMTKFIANLVYKGKFR